jgi:hypothetical protein
MAYTYHGTSNLIALPNRTVQTYPSGLVRVERSFVCRKADVVTYRKQIKTGGKMPSDDGSPAIDGLFIFPEPQEVVRGDGFVEFRVTAYGRTNKTGQRIRGPIRTREIAFDATISSVNDYYDPNSSNSSETISRYYESPYFCDVADAYYRFCVPANERIQRPADISSLGGAFVTDTDIDLFSQSFSAIEIFPFLNLGYVPSPAQRLSFAFSAFEEGFERTNFGSFDEISINYSVRPRNINFGSFLNAASPPSTQILIDQNGTPDGGIIFGIGSLTSDGVQVKIGNETLSATYGSAARGDIFGFSVSSLSQNNYFTLIIGGLAGNNTYSATVAGFNKNGPGSSQVISFSTKNIDLSRI